MNFTKMHGAGNDFVIINNIEEQIPVNQLSGIAKSVCQRRTAIGADGLMVVDKPDCGGDFKMRFYNSDGSVGEMCGNGARCLARYGYDNKLAGDTQRIETASGMVYGRRISEVEYQVQLNDVTVMKSDLKIEIENKEYIVSYVELGNPGLPHAVTEIKNLANADRNELRKLGRKLRNYKGFPKGANVNFYEPIGKDHLLELTYERGVEDFTLACGTGTGSLVAALTASGKVSGENVTVDMDGGILKVTVNNNNGIISKILLTGPTCLVASGRVILN